VNVEKLRLYEPPIIDDNEWNVQIPFIEDFSLEYLDELEEESILDKCIRTSHRGNVEYLRVGFKDTNPSKARWVKIRKMRELYPHLLSKNIFLVVKKLPVGRNDLGIKNMLKIESAQNILKPMPNHRSHCFDSSDA